jgi:SP family myo-inositol transporter-like MFS transporter 13
MTTFADKTCRCWGTNIIISCTFLSIMKGITPSGAFGFYCGICFLGCLFVVFFYPDVKGMSLETIREVFEHGFGLKFSKQWQREHKHEKKKVEAAFGH